jgi:acyl dehydratase
MRPKPIMPICIFLSIVIPRGHCPGSNRDAQCARTLNPVHCRPKGAGMARAVFNSLDDLAGKIGVEVVVSDWLEVTQDRIQQFADATGDHQWIHVDVERARRESPFGAPIAHGFLTMSLLSHFLNESLEFGKSKMGVNYGFNRLRFTAPVKVGSRLRARFTLKDFQRIEGGVQMVWDIVMESEGETKPVLVAEWVGRRYG